MLFSPSFFAQSNFRYSVKQLYFLGNSLLSKIWIMKLQCKPNHENAKDIYIENYQGIQLRLVVKKLFSNFGFRYF